MPFPPKKPMPVQNSVKPQVKPGNPKSKQQVAAMSEQEQGKGKKPNLFKSLTYKKKPDLDKDEM